MNEFGRSARWFAGSQIALVVALTVVTANAQMISVNFHEDNGQMQQILAPFEAAGAPGYLTGNWNNLIYTDVDGPAPSGPVAVGDNSGVGTTAMVSWGAGGSWGDGTANMDALAGVPNAVLQRGYLDDQGDGSVDVTVTNIPYETYDVVLYYSSDYNQTIFPGSFHHELEVNGVDSPLGGLIMSWADAPSLDIGRNVIVVFGETSSTLTIVGPPLNSPVSRGSLSGFQIVEAKTECLLGDVDLSGAVDLLDVGPFVDLITSGDFQCEGDINMSGAVDLLDVGPFINILTGGP